MRDWRLVMRSDVFVADLRRIVMEWWELETVDLRMHCVILG